MGDKVARHRAYMAKFITFCEAIIAMPEPNLSKGYLEGKKAMVATMWDKVDSMHEEIIDDLDAESELEFGPVRSEYEQAFNALDKVTVRIHTKLEKFNKQSSISVQPLQLPDNLTLNTNPKSNIKLKSIDIPTFSGDYKKWISFKNMFDSLVHKNEEFTKLQKMHYLKSCLDGEAERIISQYNITEESYEPAYNTIVERFHNEVILVDTHILSILSQPDLSSESSKGLKELMDVTNENLLALNSLRIDTESWDPILLLLLVQKLDDSTRRLWEQNLKPKVRPTIKQFLEFLATRFHALGCQQKFKFSMEQPNKQSNKKNHFTGYRRYASSEFESHSKSESSFPPRIHQNFHNSTRSRGCPFRCNDAHEALECDRFLKADILTRCDLVKCARLCKNCFKGHSGKCSSQPACKKCRRYHHDSLHFDEPIALTDTAQNAQSGSSTGPPKSLQNHHVQTECTGSKSQENKVKEQETEVIAWDEQVLLATAVILVKSMRDDSFYPFRALLDQASTSSYVTEYATQFLGLKKNNVFANVTGLGGTVTSRIDNIVDFEVGSKHNPAFSMKVQAAVVPKVTNLLPSSYVKRCDWAHIKDLRLADPEYYVPRKIDFLLGASVYGYLLLPGLVKSTSDCPVAQNTEFGWILSGAIREPVPMRNISTFHLQSNLDEQLKKFFELEEVSKVRVLTKEESECEKFYMQTYRRNEEGRFVVALPFKSDPKTLGSSKGQAISRLTKLENHFNTNKDLKEEYDTIVEEYVSLGHATRLGALTDSKEDQSYYLPHHAVFKPHSTSTKTRIVFDASAKGTEGVSLNDLLMTGPTLQEDLISILIRWRSHRFVFSADITKMYRQVEVRTEDRKYQKFLYRKNERDPIREYQHNMVTFGVKSATYLAVKSLQQLATEEAKNFPRASAVVLRDFYMDDGMSGESTEQRCIELCKDLRELLLKGKFELRKFISNSSKLLESIPEQDREMKLPMEINLDSTVKTLGIRYHPISDHFQFKVNLETTDAWPTKKSLLSETAKLFDPLGWLAPVVIRAKILFQKLWQEGLTWNQKLPERIAKEWLTFRNELHLVEENRIIRWLNKGIRTERFEIHGFSDASEAAYAAVIYARNIDEDGTVTVTMLTAKTRVAPIKVVTLPRLELCGLVLLANLMEVVREALNVKSGNIHAWTDSTVVLGWLRTNPAKLKTFVANRVVEIHNTFSVSQCHHIEGTNNPADCASRGINPSELKQHSLWWNGPDCLRQNLTSWEQELHIPEPTLELRTKCLSTFVVSSSDDLQEFIQRYSSFNRLVRMTAICLKFLDVAKKVKDDRITTLCLTFINKVRAKHKKPQIIITTDDLRKAELRIIKLCQSKDFPNEIHHLANKKPINPKSKILSFNPFLDSEGCLRMGGRLSDANIPYERKHPLILAPGSVTKLIISDMHERTMHGGTKLTINLVRESYWIINLRRQVKKYVLSCVKCCRFRKENSEQLMADLPWARVNASLPFVHTGLDYAGPYDIKASNVKSPPIRIKPVIVNGELIKSIPKVPVYQGYIALFVCLSTKAIHLEVVSDMTTEAFLAAFDRFTAERGLPECCYSDNAKTFIGAKNILAQEEENSLLDYNRVNSHMSKDGINWKFITPRAPNQGGIWESGVKSMKSHLKRVVGEAVLTYEEMSTVVAKVEACLNSRPLCPLNDDPDDLSVLTPGHFLIGRPLVARPLGRSNPIPGGLRDRWRMIQKMQQDFWKSWSQEYLNELQNRPKWLVQRRNFKEGDMILLKEDNVPATKWPLGRIIKVHPSVDGNVRSVTIKTTNGNGKLTELKRPILKLCLLPVVEEKDSSEGSDTPKESVAEDNK